MTPVSVRTASATVAALVFVACVITSPSAETPAAQTPAPAAATTQKSVGRGWPVPVPLKPFHGYPK